MHQPGSHANSLLAIMVDFPVCFFFGKSSTKCLSFLHLSLTCTFTRLPYEHLLLPTDLPPKLGCALDVLPPFANPIIFFKSIKNLILGKTARASRLLALVCPKWLADHHRREGDPLAGRHVREGNHRLERVAVRRREVGRPGRARRDQRRKQRKRLRRDRLQSAPARARRRFGLREPLLLRQKS